MKGEKSYTNWYFLLSVVILYIAIAFFDPRAILSSLEFSFLIIKNIVPVFVLVFALMTIVNYYVTPQKVAKHLSKSKGKWLFAILGGIISTGPIYMWYPMLRELKEKGVGYGFIATFLYNRAIKLPLLPVMIYYFGLKFTIVLTGVMIFFSVLQGMIIEKLEVRL